MINELVLAGLTWKEAESEDWRGRWRRSREPSGQMHLFFCCGRYVRFAMPCIHILAGKGLPIIHAAALAKFFKCYAAGSLRVLSSSTLFPRVCCGSLFCWFPSKQFLSNMKKVLKIKMYRSTDGAKKSLRMATKCWSVTAEALSTENF